MPREHTFMRYVPLPPLHMLKIFKGVFCVCRHLRCLLFWTSESRVHHSFRCIRSHQSPKKGNIYSPHLMYFKEIFLCQKIPQRKVQIHRYISSQNSRIFHSKDQPVNQIKYFALSYPLRRPSISPKTAGNQESEHSLIRTEFSVAGTVSEKAGVHSRSPIPNYSQVFP